jgi:hypothetical protein
MTKWSGSVTRKEIPGNLSKGAVFLANVKQEKKKMFMIHINLEANLQSDNLLR